MNFLPDNIDEYAVKHTQDEPPLLQELAKETWQKVLAPRMLSGHFQGRILSMISKLVKPTSILEIGTYTGYSALCLAEGMQKDGLLHTIDVNEELYDLQRSYFNRSGHGHQIVQYVGKALEIIPTLETKFDLVFIDADKSNYEHYFHAVIEKMNSGGVILSDNVLWSGKVVEKLDPNDVDTAALIAYNKILKDDKRVETILLPIRDGLTICRVN